MQILKADGTAVEAGNAIQDATGISWIYTTKGANNDLAGGKLKVTAKDKPGKKTTVELVLK